jgi:ribosomal protein S8
MTVEHNLYKEGDKNKNKIFEILYQRGYVRAFEDVTESHGLPLEDWYINRSLL